MLANAVTIAGTLVFIVPESHMHPLHRRNFMAAAIGGAALLDVAKSSAQSTPAGQSIGPMPAETRGGDMIYPAFHEVVRMEDPDRIFAPGGAHEAFADAKKAGKLRFIGFTGHKDPAIHLRMLDVAQQHGFHFDALLHPSNVMDYSFRSFVHQVMPRALKEGIGVQTMKPLGGKFILQSNTVSATECLHYAMSMPTSVVITGCDKMDMLEQALNAVKTFHPLTEAQVSALASKTKSAAFEGKYELFKTTAHFDSTAKTPQWLG